MYDVRAETMSIDERHALQGQRLRVLVSHASMVAEAAKTAVCRKRVAVS